MMSEREIGWEDQRAFLAVIETGSFSGAARRLRLRQPTVRHRIEALERALNQPLFTRSVNGLLPTEEAARLSEYVQRMAFASEAFLRAADAKDAETAGRVRISVADIIGVEVLPQMLVSLRQRFLKLDLEVVLSNTAADLLHQEADIAVRMHRPVQNALIARQVGQIKLGLFASADYIDRCGMPASIQDLADHSLIGSDRAQADLDFGRALANAIGKPVAFGYRTDSHPGQLAAVRAGLGIGVVQIPLGMRGLIRILPEFEVGQLECWIVSHEDLRRSARIESVFAHLTQAFRDYCR